MNIFASQLNEGNIFPGMNVLHKDRRTSFEKYMQQATPDEVMAIAYLGLAYDTTGKLANPSHYDIDNLPSFERIVRMDPELLEPLKGKDVDEDSRWTKENIEKGLVQLPPEVTILSHSNPEISQMMLRVSELVEELKDLENTPESRQKFGKQLVEYGSLIDQVMNAVRNEFKPAENNNGVTVSLLRGGERFEKDFALDYLLRVEAKRLSKADGHMEVGLGEFDGLSEIQNQNLADVELEFADDCLAAAVSIRSTILVLYQMYQEGTFPQISKIRCHATVGEQAGIEELLAFIKQLDPSIEIEIVVGEVAYALSEECYILRTAQEVDSKGKAFPGEKNRRRQFVGDMGGLLTAAKKYADEQRQRNSRL